jgi:hypothetical protein
MKPIQVLLFVLLAIAATASAQFMDDKVKAPAQPGVEPVIPLNKSDPTYDLWKLRRDDLSKGREPGPINVQRFPGGIGPTGIPTPLSTERSVHAIRELVREVAPSVYAGNGYA